MRGLEVCHAKGFAIKLEAVPQHVQHALKFKLFDQSVQ
jgi:hypothetical protein